MAQRDSSTLAEMSPRSTPFTRDGSQARSPGLLRGPIDTSIDLDVDYEAEVKPFLGKCLVRHPVKMKILKIEICIPGIQMFGERRPRGCRCSISLALWKP